MSREYVFYITNHGYGHAARNVPIVQEILECDQTSIIHIKSDKERILFLKRNLKENVERIFYYEDYKDVGLILKKETLDVDISEMKKQVGDELKKWKEYIENELLFFSVHPIDVVISDVIPWAILAAKKAKIPSVLLCNFTWYEMYRDFLDEELYMPYYRAYSAADKILLYAMGNKEILTYNSYGENVSMVSRKSNTVHVHEIRDKFPHPLVFVSVGKSVELELCYDVSDINAHFLTTAGIRLLGNNVTVLPPDLICTQDYISASDYVIAKAGWSTMAEIFLHKKKSALLVRGENAEDNQVKKIINNSHCAVEIHLEDLKNIKFILSRIDLVDAKSMNIFRDDKKKIVESIINM